MQDESVVDAWSRVALSEDPSDIRVMEEVWQSEYKIREHTRLVRRAFGNRIKEFLPVSGALVPRDEYEPRTRGRYLLGVYGRLQRDKASMKPVLWVRRCNRQLRFSERLLWGLGVSLKAIIQIDEQATHLSREAAVEVRRQNTRLLSLGVGFQLVPDPVPDPELVPGTDGTGGG